MPLDISKGGTASATAAGARLKLGLTDLATMDPTDVNITGGTIDGVNITGGTLSGLTSPLAITDGGTSSTTAASARTSLFGVSTTTDNAVARYDGITGALQNSTVTIDDSGNIVTSGSITGASFTGTIDADTLDGIDSTGFATAAQGTLADNAMPKSGGTFTGGISFGSTAQASATDLSRHIKLWGSSFGFSISNLSLNYVVDAASGHHWYNGATNTLSLTASGLTVGSATGGAPGAGKINAVDYQINGTPLSSLFVSISDYTAADVLTKIKTVDGSGSGLDADTLDGHDTSYFQTALGYTPANVAGDTFTGQLKMTDGIEMVVGSGNLFRMKSNGIAASTGYGVFWRIDGNNTYLMRTALDDPNGSWTSPFVMTIGHASKLISVAGDPTSALGVATKQYVDAKPLSKFYESAQQTITSAGSLTLAHGLGATPTLIQLVLICTVANAGYAVGNILLVPILAHGTTDYGVSVWADATNINVRYGANSPCFIASHATTGVQIGLTNSSWKFVIRAWL